MSAAILFKCPLSNSIWMFPKFLKCNLFKMELLVRQSYPLLQYPSPVIHLSLLPGKGNHHPTRGLEWSLIPVSFNPYSESKSSSLTIFLQQPPSWFPASMLACFLQSILQSHKVVFEKGKSDQVTHLCKSLQCLPSSSKVHKPLRSLAFLSLQLHLLPPS